MLVLTNEWMDVKFEKIFQLYESVGWTNYTRDKEALFKAFKNSSLVVLAIEDDRILGALRSVSDDVSIHYLQDVLVTPEQQGKGIGKKLVEKALSRYSHVRTHLLLTDDELKQEKFYSFLGYENLKNFKMKTLNAFIKDGRP